MALRPMHRSKAAARAACDRLIGWYDWLAGASEWGLVSAGLQRLAVQPGEAVLEVGGGRYLAVRLYEWAHNAFPAVVDCRPILLAAALETAGFCRVQGEVCLLYGLPVGLVAVRR
jgi:hypothetical protein